MQINRLTCFVVFEKRLRSINKAQKILKANEIKFIVIGDKSSSLKTLWIYQKSTEDIKNILDVNKIIYKDILSSGRGVHHEQI